MLSKRLQAIADLIPANSRVIDVGCDHGLLSIYLSKYKNCACIATDISKYAVDSAIKNVNKYQVEVEVVVTDGLNNINIDNTDYIVIAGMGTYTIMHILNTKNLSDNLIISSQNHLKELRMFLVDLGYKIEQEIWLEDNDKDYIILKLIKKDIQYNELEYEYGPILINNDAYIEHVINKKESILQKIPLDKYIIRTKYENEINKLKQKL